MKPRTIGILAALLAALAVSAWALFGRTPAATSLSGVTLGSSSAGISQRDLNVVIITLDTTRWDRLGAYGAAAGSTPNLDKLASDGVVFEQAITSVPLTLPAHSTLFTGLLPPRHGVRDNGGYVLDPKHVTLASVLKAQEIATGAFVGAFVLDGKWGLNKGFETYHDKFDVSKYKSTSLGDIARRAN